MPGTEFGKKYSVGKSSRAETDHMPLRNLGEIKRERERDVERCSSFFFLSFFFFLTRNVPLKFLQVELYEVDKKQQSSLVHSLSISYV